MFWQTLLQKREANKRQESNCPTKANTDYNNGDQPY